MNGQTDPTSPETQPADAALQIPAALEVPPVEINSISTPPPPSSEQLAHLEAQLETVIGQRNDLEDQVSVLTIKVRALEAEIAAAQPKPANVVKCEKCGRDLIPNHPGNCNC